MKIILSRKGFDSSAGGYPSPILPDGTFLSLPIPGKNSIKYSELKVNNNTSYFDIMKQLKSQIKINGKWKDFNENIECHLDPDLNSNIIKRDIGWMPIFGQTGNARSHLVNQNVEEDDLFLFFGLFNKTVNVKGKIVFDKTSKPFHIIYGYMEIDKIHHIRLDTQCEKWMRYHPHVKYKKEFNESILFQASNKLSFESRFSGAGVFKYNKSLVLTKDGYKKSQWDLPVCFKDVNITYHTNTISYGWKEDCFYSAARGQEFVIEENEGITNWAKDIILCNQ